FYLKRFYLYISIIPLIFIINYIYASLIFFLGKNQSSVEFLVTSAVMLAISFFLSTIAKSRHDLPEIINLSFLVSGIIVIVANLIEYFLGYGYVPGIPRFFGTSSHPNFIGVQMAVFGIVIAGNIKFSSLLPDLLKLSLLGSSVFFLYISGSRTGIAVLLFGIYALVLSRRQLSKIGRAS